MVPQLVLWSHFDNDMESNMLFESESGSVRRRRVGKAATVEEVEEVHWGGERQVLRLFLLALVSLAAFATLLVIVDQELERGPPATPQECQELREMDEAARSLGLDGFPGYVETCFSTKERLWMAVRPFTEPAGAVLKEVMRRLHRIRRRLKRWLPLIPRVVYRTIASGVRPLVDAVAIKGDGAPEAPEAPKELKGAEEPLPSWRDSKKEGGPEGSQPVPQDDSDEVLPLTKGDLKLFATLLGRYLDKELDEGATDAILQSLASARASRASRAGEL